MDLALGGEKSFSLMRPPGHHAGRSSVEGFCYFNNIAIATSRALESVDRAAIIDVDCHHGNGTQDIFLGNSRVLFVSLHQYGSLGQGPFYPGTGGVSEKNCLNYPVTIGTNEETYLRVLKKALKEVARFNPDIVGVSAGFDAYKNDPITSLNLDKETFGKISMMISDIGVPTFSVLEGGYSSELPQCIQEFLKGYE